MKIYNLPRGAGKSTRMLYISEFKEIPILCFSREHKRHLLDCAKTYGINIPEPIVITEITNDKNIDIKDVLVDESLLALQKILNSKGLNMIGCTLSDEKNDTTLRDFNTNGYKDCDIKSFPENKMCQAEEIFPFETLEQCRTHYCKPIQKYISCKEFGKLDGMDGSCHWCREMTPLQFEMCWDESTVCNYERCGKAREEAIQLVEKKKIKSVYRHQCL